MAGIENKKLKNLFFYGVSFVNYDSTDVTLDIITNIRKRFLVTKKPASNKLYRSANGESFVYSYNFSFERPLQWRVLKNKRVVEEIESLLSGKYCINLYDEQGKDLKKTFFDSKHRWFKTNYYSPVSNEDLVCSLVPKNFDDETSLLKYMTGEVYPERLYPCSIPSCEEVRGRVLLRIPTPLVTALTNYGIVYFMPEVDKENYEHVLAEEEEIYSKENAPKVYVTAEDVESGFNLSVRDFDMSKNLNRTFDISLAADFESDKSEFSVVTDVKPEPQKTEDDIAVIADDGSVDAAISGVVEQINALTSLDIDAQKILGSDFISMDKSGEEAKANEDYITFNDSDFGIDEQLKHIDSVLDGSSLLNSERKLVIGESVVDDDYISSIIDGIISSAFSSDDDEEDVKKDETAENTEENDVAEENPAEDIPENQFAQEAVVIEVLEEPEIISEEENIAEAVENAIDYNASQDETSCEEILEVESAEEKEETVDETAEEKAENDTPEEEAVDALVEEILSKLSAADQYIKDNPADITIESRGEIYSYYGSVDENGKRSGRGRTLMSDGSIAYEGEYKDDKRKGKGSFYFKDGSLCYWGNWDNNVRSGFGVGVSSDDKAVHVGNWTDNKPAGAGARFDAEGNLMFVSSNCDDKKKGFTISDLSNESFTIRVWSEKDDAYIQREISISDIIK